MTTFGGWDGISCVRINDLIIIIKLFFYVRGSARWKGKGKYIIRRTLKSRGICFPKDANDRSMKSWLKNNIENIKFA